MAHVEPGHIEPGGHQRGDLVRARRRRPESADDLRSAAHGGAPSPVAASANSAPTLGELPERASGLYHYEVSAAPWREWGRAFTRCAPARRAAAFVMVGPTMTREGVAKIGTTPSPLTRPDAARGTDHDYSALRSPGLR